MDTSKEYIQMCQKATKIQELKKPMEGDFISCFSTSIEVIAEHHATLYRDHPEYLKNDIWIPRQDQLQEMIDIKKYAIPTKSTLLTVFFIFCTRARGYKVKPRIKMFGSFEQLWLAFVMFENYNMKWNFENNEWISNKRK